MDRQSLIASIEEGMKRVREYASLEVRVLKNSYAPGKWNGLQILGHLADTDLVLLYRIEKTISEEGSPVVPFDQDRWVTELESDRRPPAVSAALVEAVRTAVMLLLRTLPEDKWARSGHHAERGIVTAFELAAIMSRHTLHHCEQLEAIRQGVEWKPSQP